QAGDSTGGGRGRTGSARKNKPQPTGEKKPAPAPPGGGRRLAGEASFLGTRATGQRFCIIADNSGSMKGAPLDHVKQELLKTLCDLKEGTQFYVIFFNTKAVAMPFDGWLDAGQASVDKVIPWLEGITAKGGTQPTPAFTQAMQLNPRPDVIFFMTDGLIPASVPDQVAAMNSQQPKV